MVKQLEEKLLEQKLSLEEVKIVLSRLYDQNIGVSETEKIQKLSDALNKIKGAIGDLNLSINGDLDWKNE